MMEIENKETKETSSVKTKIKYDTERTNYKIYKLLRAWGE